MIGLFFKEEKIFKFNFIYVKLKCRKKYKVCGIQKNIQEDILYIWIVFFEVCRGIGWGVFGDINFGIFKFWYYLNILIMIIMLIFKNVKNSFFFVRFGIISL